MDNLAAHGQPARPTVHFLVDASGVSGGFNAGGDAVLGLGSFPRPAEGFTKGDRVLLGGGPVKAPRLAHQLAKIVLH